MHITQELTVGEIAAAEPSSIRVFESLGIDYCCGGKRGLTDACSRIGVPVEDVISRITQAERDANTPTPPEWAQTRLADIIRHIVEHHHAYIRNETPRITGLLAKVVARHGETHPHVAEIQDLFIATSQELITHALKEEQVLFPHIVRMEQAINAGQPLPPAFFGSVSMPIAHMVADQMTPARFSRASNNSPEILFRPKAHALPSGRSTRLSTNSSAIFTRTFTSKITFSSRAPSPSNAESELWRAGSFCGARRLRTRRLSVVRCSLFFLR